MDSARTNTADVPPGPPLARLAPLRRYCSGVPLALGEEWRTVYEVRPRLERRSMSILQPEMGHTGISQFMQIARMANAFHVKVIPHASIGIGIYQAASLHAAAALPNCPMSMPIRCAIRCWAGHWSRAMCWPSIC